MPSSNRSHTVWPSTILPSVTLTMITLRRSSGRAARMATSRRAPARRLDGDCRPNKSGRTTGKQTSCFATPGHSPSRSSASRASSDTSTRRSAWQAIRSKRDQPAADDRFVIVRMGWWRLSRYQEGLRCRRVSGPWHRERSRRDKSRFAFSGRFHWSSRIASFALTFRSTGRITPLLRRVVLTLCIVK